MENAKKNLVFHFGVGRQASFLKIGYVKFNFGLMGWPLQPPRERVPNINKTALLSICTGILGTFDFLQFEISSLMN